MKLPLEATIVEVGPRDGLQNEKKMLSAEQKVHLVERLSGAGLKRIEVVSFVHPKAVPQMANAEKVMKGIKRRPGTQYLALVPNTVGAERALASGAGGLGFFVSASETHNMHNVRMSRQASMAELARVSRLAAEARVPLRSYIVTAFGCPYEGKTPASTVVSMAKQMFDEGAAEVCLGDTTGMGNPAQVETVFYELTRQLPANRLAAHFHNTRGAALANVYAALRAGITTFDGAVGGTGGCPFAPGASGNVATEDLVNMLEDMGVHTGVDLDELITCALEIEDILGRPLSNSVARAGPSWRLHDPPGRL